MNGGISDLCELGASPCQAPLTSLTEEKLRQEGQHDPPENLQQNPLSFLGRYPALHCPSRGGNKKAGSPLNLLMGVVPLPTAASCGSSRAAGKGMPVGPWCWC